MKKKYEGAPYVIVGYGRGRKLVVAEDDKLYVHPKDDEYMYLLCSTRDEIEDMKESLDQIKVFVQDL